MEMIKEEVNNKYKEDMKEKIEEMMKDKEDMKDTINTTLDQKYLHTFDNLQKAMQDEVRSECEKFVKNIDDRVKRLDDIVRSLRRPSDQEIRAEMARDAIEQLEAEEKDAVAKKDYVEANRLKNKIDEIKTGTQGKVQERRHDSIQESIQERDAIQERHQDSIQERHQDSVQEPQRDLLFDHDASGGAWSRFHIGTPTRTRAKPGRAPVTSLTRPASAGDTVLTVDDNHGFELNDKILIGTELGTIVKFGSFHLARPLRHDHPAGTAVTRVEDEVANPPGLSTEKFGPEDPQDIRQYKSFTTDANTH